MCAGPPFYGNINLWTALSDSLLSAVLAHSTLVYMYSIYIFKSHILASVKLGSIAGGVERIPSVL